MKIDLKKRLAKDRPMDSVTIRVPSDVIDELKQLAPRLGFSGYQPLIRFYVGQGLRTDIRKLQNEENAGQAVAQRLRARGVSEEVIKEALAA